MSSCMHGLHKRNRDSAMRVLGVALLVAAVLAGCASTRVVRSPPGRHTGAPVRVSAPKYGAIATVRQGDTLYRIATDNGISPLDLAMWNTVPPPYTIHPGDRLRLYPADRSNSLARAPTRNATPPARGAMPAPARPVAIPPDVAVPTPPAATPASPFRWVWPADGTLAGRYAAGEPTQQGIDIAGQAGQPVRSAADGVVVYSGSGLVGYGELIIVKHNDAWLSAYGHNRARLVNEGQVVKAGQQIAEMGHSGASRDMLHFEIRFNGKPVDPLVLLPRR